MMSATEFQEYVAKAGAPWMGEGARSRIRMLTVTRGALPSEVLEIAATGLTMNELSRTAIEREISRRHAAMDPHAEDPIEQKVYTPSLAPSTDWRSVFHDE